MYARLIVRNKNLFIYFTIISNGLQNNGQVGSMYYIKYVVLVKTSEYKIINISKLLYIIIYLYNAVCSLFIVLLLIIVCALIIRVCYNSLITCT